MSVRDTAIDAPAEDAWDVYDRSLGRLVSADQPINERIRQAFEAGYDAGRRATEGTFSVDDVIREYEERR